MDYAYLVTLGAMIAVIAATALYTDQLHRKENVQAAAPAPEVESTPAPPPQTTPTSTPLPTLAPLRASSTLNAVRPVSGEVIRGFSDQPVFWEALACWQAHPALDIEAAPGENVLCLRDGVVTACSRDALWGWRRSGTLRGRNRAKHHTRAGHRRTDGRDTCRKRVGRTSASGAVGERKSAGREE